MQKPTPLKLELFIKGVQQINVAREAGVTKGYVCRIVNGHQPCSEKVAKAFKKFGIEIEVDE